MEDEAVSETPTIHIHTDKKCPRCKKPGATGERGTGPCLKCVVKMLKSGELDVWTAPWRAKRADRDV